jgi:serine/threonine-protein kinase
MESLRWDEIQATFDALIELDAAGRSHGLATLSSSDPELRAAVESLLAADSDADAQLASLEAAFLPSQAPVPDPLGLTGRTISHFEVRELLGAGGMGAVYRAEDTRLSREVALKFLLPSHGLDAGSKARFLREAHSAAALDHPSLCAIYEVGASEDGRLFMAMPLYAGETLQARLARDGPMSVTEAFRIVRQIAEGLECAHAAGIVHRDLKPANVMLLPDSSVKVLDFGLAKARDQSLTKSGARFGTVAYMSPEQIRGLGVDARSDLWALGVVLYEMLTGRKPFGGEEEFAVAHAILHDRPNISALRGAVPEAAEDVVLRLLQQDPAMRYAAAANLLTDLEKVGIIEQSDRRRTRWSRAIRLLRGKRRRIAATLSVLMVAAVAYAPTAWKTNRVPAPVITADRTAIAVLPFTSSSLQQVTGGNITGALREEIVAQLNKVSSLRVAGQWSSMSYDGAGTFPIPQIASQLGVRSILRGTTTSENGLVFLTLQLIDAATNRQIWAKRYNFGGLWNSSVHPPNSGDIARDIVTALGAPLSDAERQAIAVAATGNDEAYHRYLEGLEYLSRPRRTLQDVEIAQSYFDRAVALDSGFAMALAARSSSENMLRQLVPGHPLGESDPARKDARAALRFAPDLPQAHVAIARLYLNPAGATTSDYEKAYDEYSIALKALPHEADLWGMIGGLSRGLGRWTESVSSFEKASDLDPLNSYWSFERGRTLAYMRRYPEAIRSFDRSSMAATAWAEVRQDSASRSSAQFSLRKTAVEKAWSYVLARGELDTLRTVVDRIRNNGWLTARNEEYAQLLYWERQPDSLLNLLRTLDIRWVTVGTNVWPSSLLAAFAHEMRGDTSAARAAFDSVRAGLDTMVDPDWAGSRHAARGLALAGLGRHREALNDARWLRDSAVFRNAKFEEPILREYRARIFAHAGEPDLALDEIEHLLAEPSLTSVHTLRLDPIWDPIRKHPRFRALLAKYASEPVH